MSKILREKLQSAAKNKKRNILITTLARELSAQENDFFVFDKSFQNLVTLAEEKGLKLNEGFKSISDCEVDFKHFTDGIDQSDFVSFMVSSEKDYFFIKTSASIFLRNPSFLFTSEVLHLTKSNRAYIRNDNDSGIIILDSEYGLDICQW